MQTRSALSLVLCGAFFLSACARSAPPPGETASDSAPAADSASASAPASASASAPAPASASASAPDSSATIASARFADAVRLERWDDAEAQIAALPEAERAKPEMRYVRGRVALSRGEAAKAVELLQNLETELPLLADEILRRRAEAASVAGPYAEAVAYFGKSAKPQELLFAVRALANDKKLIEAKALCDKALALAEKTRKKGDDIPLRAERAKISLAQGAIAAATADLRKLALDAAGKTEGEEAAKKLVEIGQTLAAKEKLERALAMIRAGSADAAVPLLDELEKTKSLPALEVKHARAEALLKARDYPAAEKAYRTLAAIDPARRAESLYQAATALARSGKADEAIRHYLDLSAKLKKSTWAERALYQAARWLLLRGRYDEAAPLYTRYLAMFPRGMFRSDAEYEQALAELSAAAPKNAQKKLHQLAAQESKIDEIQKLRELEGVAALRAGDREEAIRLFTDVAKTLPLSFAALAARARLASIGAPLPPLLEPAIARPQIPLPLSLPNPAQLLVSIGLDTDAEAQLVSYEPKATSLFVGREGEALCGLYGKLAHARRRYRVGIAQVGLSQLLRAPAEADRWAWDCLYPRPYLEEVVRLEAEQKLPKGIVHSLMRQESAFDHEALSPVFAVGLLQLMPKTAEKAAAELKIDFDRGTLSSPHVNLQLGSYYIGKLLGTFQKNPVLSIAAYNAGPKAVGQWTSKTMDADADLWVARIPYDETRTYVARVLGNLARYQWLEGGDAAVEALPLKLPSDIEVPADAY